VTTSLVAGPRNANKRFGPSTSCGSRFLAKRKSLPLRGILVRLRSECRTLWFGCSRPVKLVREQVLTANSLPFVHRIRHPHFWNLSSSSLLNYIASRSQPCRTYATFGCLRPVQSSPASPTCPNALPRHGAAARGHRTARPFRLRSDPPLVVRFHFLPLAIGAALQPR
jgi:hypothetical protein